MEDRGLLVLSALISSILFSFFFEQIKWQYVTSPILKIIRRYKEKITAENLQKQKILQELAIVLAAIFLISVAVIIISGNIVAFVLLAVTMPTAGTIKKASMVKKNLQLNNIAAARIQFTGTPMRHYAVMDKNSLAKAAIEYVTIQFFEKITAPIFWFMALGVVGLILSIAVNLLHESNFSGSTESNDFDKVINTTWRFFNYIPSRLAVFLWIIAAIFLPSGSSIEKMEPIGNEIISSPPTRLAIAASAYSLNLSLGGNTSVYYRESTIGNGKTMLLPSDISRVQFLFSISCLVLFIIIGVFLF